MQRVFSPFNFIFKAEYTHACKLSNNGAIHPETIFAAAECPTFPSGGLRGGGGGGGRGGGRGGGGALGASAPPAESMVKKILADLFSFQCTVGTFLRVL